MNNIVFGKFGEEMAAGYLLASGHRILETGYRNCLGEIDIISEKDDKIHFIEVKTRRGLRYGRPSEAVTRDKLKHIRNVANTYINSMETRIKRKMVDGEYENKDYAIDVIEVLVNHIEGVE